MIKFDNSVILVLNGMEKYNFFKDILGDDLLYDFKEVKNNKDYIFGLKVSKVFVEESNFIVLIENLKTDKIEENLRKNNRKFKKEKTDNKNIISFYDLDCHIFKIVD